MSKVIQKDLIDSFWTMLQELEDHANNEDDRVLKHQVEGWYRQWNRMTNSNQSPRWTKTYAWECNECGSQEYTMSVSEDDVQNLGCGSCGGNEWHKAEAND